MQGDILEQVRNAVESILGRALSDDQPLMEAGLDSLGAVELRNSLASHYGLDLSASLVFDYPSIQALSVYLASLVQPDDRLSTPVHASKRQTEAQGHLSEVVGISAQYPGAGLGELQTITMACLSPSYYKAFRINQMDTPSPPPPNQIAC